MSPDNQQDGPDAWSFLRLTGEDQPPAGSGALTEGRHRKLANLMTELPSVLQDVGCTCLAKKLALYYEDDPASENQQCCTSEPRRSTLNLLCQLQPLSRALREAGYYDHALSCAELARSIEPTMDLNLLRAYLFLALGDNEKACQIYRRAVKKLGSIPEHELDRLRQLVERHSAEEDMGDILEELNSCCRARSAKNKT